MTNTPSERNKEIIIEGKHLKKYFPIKRGIFKRTIRHVKAVDDVSLTVYKGETLGVIGEAGSGKSTLARLMARLIEPTDGRVLFREQDISHLSQRKLRSFRKELQMIFQDSHGSFNPRMTVGALIEEPMFLRREFSTKRRRKKVKEILEAVGLPSQARFKYPHQFSGGQRQRIGIARALAVQPAFIIGDEPVSSLDVSVQAQILNLLKDLQEQFHLTYLFISHDIRVVTHMSDRIAVMYRGSIVEVAPAHDLYKRPLHPYTQSLLSSALRLGRGASVTSATENREEEGCPFQPYCSSSHSNCRQLRPQLVDTGNNHYVACHRIYEKRR